MSLAELAVKKRTLTYFITGLLVVAGFAAYVGLGKLEDPTFTVKTAAIVTSYPGASPEEVEQEVTEVIERKLQELHQVKWLESLSRPGSSYITVEIKGKFLSREMPQIFDEIRRKVNDVAIELPPGAQTPQIHDDVGEVFGFLLALVGDGYSPRELEDYADDVRRELGLVTGAARVDLWGVQKEAIFVDVADTQTEQLGISLNNFYSTLSQQNEVLHAGGVELGSQRMRIEAAGAFQSPEEIEDLTFRASLSDSLSSGSLEQRDSLVRLSDFARVRRGYVDPPSTLMRYDGLPAVGLAISVEDGGNVSDLGAALDKRIAELQDTLPIGIELHKVSWQSDLVDESINSFMLSLFQAVLIVLVILWIAMGRQNAIIVGTALVMTILATFVVMKLMAIDLERMSLGALVIALGMMVDNAIVVADGAYVRIQQGMGRVQASIAAAMGPSMPLLGATVIAVSFFFPIYISTESTGEYCASLFLVVAISLLISWVVSITITPLQCAAMLERDEEAEGEAFEGKFFDSFRSVLRFAIKRRWLTLAVMLFALFGSVSLFP
jgi:multidrug efflux pump subunit AcrB